MLVKGLLEKIALEANSRQNQRLAKELITIVENNPCQLLADEKDLIQSLGIRTQMIIKDIRLYETGRVSTIWELYTKTKTDTKRWADIALPSSGEKRRAVYVWLTNDAMSFPSRESHD